MLINMIIRSEEDERLLIYFTLHVTIDINLLVSATYNN